MRAISELHRRCSSGHAAIYTLAHFIQEFLEAPTVDPREFVFLFEMDIAVFADHVSIAFQQNLSGGVQCMQEDLDADPDFLAGPITVDQGIHPCPLFLEDKWAASGRRHLITMFRKYGLCRRLDLGERSIADDHRSQAG